MFFRNFLSKGPIYSWKKVFLTLIFSMMGVSSIATAAYFLTTKQKPGCTIQAVVQTGPRYAALETAYLAEVMNLSVDHPTDFHRFDLKEAEERLLATWVIGEAMLKRVKPNILYVNYTLREPLAKLGDYTNTALDKEGSFFPFAPFYSPQILPQVYLGEHAPPNPWGEQMKESHREIVHALLYRFDLAKIESIDLSQVEALSAGKRQIVLVLRGGTILRLTPKNYPQELANYFMLERLTLKGESAPHLIDLRIPEIAYITRIHE